ncbi:hypothetical protein HanPI659440_Chr08g0296361 [Helianthus annuus]|nr:hypothetical protein HanPI659440_Chr08g0296361 [Helianthus annuus]
MIRIEVKLLTQLFVILYLLVVFVLQIINATIAGDIVLISYYLYVPHCNLIHDRFLSAL